MAHCARSSSEFVMPLTMHEHDYVATTAVVIRHCVSCAVDVVEWTRAAVGCATGVVGAVVCGVCGTGCSTRPPR